MIATREKPFIMKDSQACAVALRHWLKDRPFFNSYSMSPINGQTPISLVHDSNPDSDWGKVKGRAGKVICQGPSDSNAVKLAETVIRKHLGWPERGE
jgi:hypothetical protein